MNLHLFYCTLLLCYIQGYGNFIQGYGNFAGSPNASQAKDVFLGNGVFATTISTSDTITCAILSNNQLLCWEGGTHGKLIFFPFFGICR
jgi:hypothetical protein